MLSRIDSPKAQASRLETIWVRSEILKNNPAGISAERPISVYLPELAKEKATMRFPVLYCLATWTSAGRQQFNWQAFRESLADRLDRLISTQKMPPAIVVCPDLYTDFGGSQYINSDYLGLHGDFIVKELLSFVENQLPVQPGAKSRAVFGCSSGGFGSLRLAMDYPGTFAAVACHSGDLGFDTGLRRDLVELCQGLAPFDGDVKAFLTDCRQAQKLSGRQTYLLMILGMAASYSPNVESPAGFDLPIDLFDGSLRHDVWQRWLEHDPLLRVDHSSDGLRQLKKLFIDCGNRDQYHLHFGARQLHKKLAAMGIEHTYEEFNDNHSGIAYRYDVSLPILVKALTQNP